MGDLNAEVTNQCSSEFFLIATEKHNKRACMHDLKM